MVRSALLLVSVLAAAVPPAMAQAAKAAPVEVVGAEFGVFQENRPGELTFAPTKVVPHKVGQRYGWIIEVRTARRTLAVREEYLLPIPPKVREEAAHAADGTLKIPLERRNQVSQRQLVPVAGKIYGEWSVGPNEPAGHRHLQVIVEGELGADFEYDVK